MQCLRLRLDQKTILQHKRPLFVGHKLMTLKVSYSTLKSSNMLASRLWQLDGECVSRRQQSHVLDGTAIFDRAPGSLVQKKRYERPGRGTFIKTIDLDPGAAERTVMRLFAPLPQHTLDADVNTPPSDLSDVPSPHGRLSPRVYSGGNLIGPLSQPRLSVPCRI